MSTDTLQYELEQMDNGILVAHCQINGNSYDHSVSGVPLNPDTDRGMERIRHILHNSADPQVPGEAAAKIPDPDPADRAEMEKAFKSMTELLQKGAGNDPAAVPGASQLE